MAADKSTATTYYMVQDKRGSTKPEAWREYLTTNLTPIYRKHGTYFTDEAEWLEAIIDNEPAQKAMGVLIREATDEDMENYGSDIAVGEALARYQEADLIAKQTKREARLEVTKWLDEHCETADDLQDFLTNHKQNHRVILSWMRRARVEDGYEVGDALKHAYASLAYGKLKTADQKKTSLKTYLDGFYTDKSMASADEDADE
ncbi:hypothetical protein [Propionibacterium freudenreichii]|uniref:hypothetical protein n=2 Tax=Propionibacterium freudenreichii TaxID=1744 RepID=UPI0005A5CC4F|nr:hypothetical protein [Propionibacterium freudenreichii]MDK9302571.1 hypothetical protein [Propionibacterium freudenreichii]MDK9322617.1 hypothetical protein [Propionibacterium freudenreichii]MDK9324391.1 hypothetical protein [Propionibacterium freudenreichii]MDK9340247.1 hypothetical protein [Propionibacterium freudenreichii]MDK9649419.1 hypothetical protein [Propionibacterium freudenreichii]